MLLRNKALVERWVDEIANAQNIDALDEFYSEACVFHVNPYSGIGFVPDFTERDHIVVYYVSPKGPADGLLEPGDELVRARIGDKTLESGDLRSSQIWGHGPPGDTVHFSVKRNNDRFDVAVTRDLITDAEFRGFLEAAYAEFYRRYPDIHAIIEFMIAEDDLVASRIRWSGYNAEYDGDVTWTETLVFRIADGKIVEVWSNEDSLSAMHQLGYAITAPEKAKIVTQKPPAIDWTV